MNRTTWLRLERWYHSLHRVQQWLVWLGLALFVSMFAVIVTHGPTDRPRQPRIILDCYEGCGSDPARTISYNEYMNRKEQAQQVRFREERARIQQQARDERGRARWCREHPQDRNCRP